MTNIIPISYLLRISQKIVKRSKQDILEKEVKKITALIPGYETKNKFNKLTNNNNIQHTKEKQPHFCVWWFLS